jgi:gliding motility-associated-like protein
MNFVKYIFLLLPFLGFTQLVTTNNQTVGSLVQNVLLGPGVSVSNITYSGAPQAIGYFSSLGTNLGIEQGIIMTTGTVQNNPGSGPHGPNNVGNADVDNGYGGNQQLSQLVEGTQTYNAAILEFDFIPYADTVRFRYIFGSEEYMEYVNTKFNDVFAFFISGPGITGQKNIALLPDGNPVTINNVNNGTNNTGPCKNCDYYVYNGTGSDSPYRNSSTYIQYDGFTKPLEAFSEVQCGKTYHLKIAIADVGDGLWDSGIFLEANSLTSKVPITVSHQISYNAFSDPNMMAEGCVSATVTLNRDPTKSDEAITIPINVTGTATQGIDYTNIPTTITFQPGQSVVEFSFEALEDGITEGVETINIEILVPDACGGIIPHYINLTINDVEPVSVFVEEPTLLCPGEEVELLAIPSGGVGPYDFSWSTGATTRGIMVSLTTTQTFSVSVTDFCLNQTATAFVTVNVPVFDPLELTITPDITEICPYLETVLEVFPVGGAGSYMFQWYGNEEQLDRRNVQTVFPSPGVTIYHVVVTDQCNETAEIQMIYTVLSPPLEIETSPEQIICPLDSVTIDVVATGGFGQYYYNWIHSGQNTPEVWVNPNQSTVYTVHVSDECQTFYIEGNTTVTVIKPIADFSFVSNVLFQNLPITFQNLTQNGMTYEWDFGNGFQSTVVHPNQEFVEPGGYVITLIATDYLGCTDTIQKKIVIQEEFYIYVPNAFTPDGNTYNNTFSASTVNIEKLNVSIFNRWGELVYNSDKVRFAWDGTYNGIVSQDGVYVYKINYTTYSKVEGEIIGHVTLIK